MKLVLLSSTILLAASTCLRAEPPGMSDAQEGFLYAKEVCANCHAIVYSEASPVREFQLLTKSPNSRFTAAMVAAQAHSLGALRGGPFPD